jgi:NAD(P)H-hydrate epimerase
VQLAAPEVIQALLVNGLPDVIHEPLPSSEGALDSEAARALLRALEIGHSKALLVGPGLSLTTGTRGFVRELVGGMDGIESLEALVLDADALNAVAEEPEWWTRLAVPRVLTPHPAEMARLTGTSVEAVQSDRLGNAARYAELTGSVVVLKGACTVVAGPDGRARLSAAANAMLATAGTGDVLAGLIAGLLVQGMTPYDAASAAVYLHSDMGRRVAESHGTAAGLAQDLLKVLPDARRLLESVSSASSMPDFGDMGGMGGLGGAGSGMGGGMPDLGGPVLGF